MAAPGTGGFYRSQFWRELRGKALQRDRYTCTVPGCRARAKRVDHIETRPRVPYPTTFDVLGNLRSLCSVHDNQVKEGPSGARAQSRFIVRGCDADGWPLDPARRG